MERIVNTRLEIEYHTELLSWFAYCRGYRYSKPDKDRFVVESKRTKLEIYPLHYFYKLNGGKLTTYKDILDLLWKEYPSMS